MDKIIAWWGKTVFVSLCVSIVLLGTGPLDLSSFGFSVSAWSVSRTTFFFWLLWKLAIAIRYGRSQVGFREPGIPIPPILFFTFVTVSLLPDFHLAADYRYFFLGAMHYLMIFDHCADPKRWKLILCLLALLPGLLAVRGIVYDPLVLELGQMRRFGYPLPHPNIAGYLFAMTLPICLALAVGETGRLRAASLTSGSAQLLALILTYSRGSWLGFCAAIFSFGVMLKRWKEIWVILAIVGLLLSFAIPLQQRVLSLVRPQTDFSINERIEAMDAGLRVGIRHPVFGVGYGRGRLREGLKELHPNVGHIAHTHNMYVELFAETGLLGLGSFLWLWVHAFAQILRNVNRLESPGRILELGIAAAWIAFAVTGFGDVPLFHHEIRIVFFTLLALTHVHSPRASLASSAARD
jgi:putative inorganic carbon (HCO3(-)) transporter